MRIYYEKKYFIYSFFVVLIIFLLLSYIFKKSSYKPLGSEENPIVWAFLPSGKTERITAGAEEIAKILHNMTGYYFKIKVALSYAGVIEALSSNPPSAHISSLGGFSYIVASEKNIAKAYLVAVRYGSTTFTGQIIVRKDRGIKSLSDLKGKTFARHDPLSTSGWLIPGLMLKSYGINIDKDLKIIDTGSHEGVVAAIYNGEADVGSCYVDARTRLEKEYPDVFDVVVPIKLTPPIPNDGVQFKPVVPANIREKLLKRL